MCKTRVQLILASNSPRRKELLKLTGINFKTINIQYDEQYPNHLKNFEIVRHIVYHKAKSIGDISTDKNVIVVADTIVWNVSHCLGKSENKEQAFRMLQQLSGRTHQVITGVGFLFNKQIDFMHQTTEVKFKNLENNEILHYINRYTPYDKAGSYGIQEWIGLIGIEWIKGSYTNVVGLPLSHVHDKLKEYATRYDFD